LGRQFIERRNHVFVGEVLRYRGFIRQRRFPSRFVFGRPSAIEFQPFAAVITDDAEEDGVKPGANVRAWRKTVN
jgi:hypothetical protein